jgi:hypothetical protein
VDLQSWPDLVDLMDLPFRWEVTECVELFEATVVHSGQGKSRVLLLSFPKCFAGTQIYIEHGSRTRYVTMSILPGQEIGRVHSQ